MTRQSRDEILEKVSVAFLRASNGRAMRESLSEDARIIEDVGLSSLDVLELRYEIERNWKIKIENETLAQLRTVGDIVRLIEEFDAGKPA